MISEKESAGGLFPTTLAGVISLLFLLHALGKHDPTLPTKFQDMIELRGTGNEKDTMALCNLRSLSWV